MISSSYCLIVLFMIIGIDISQVVYEGTGVATYVRRMVEALLSVDNHNAYVLFGSSLRMRAKLFEFADGLRKKYSNISYRIFPFPPTFLDILWNRFHVIPIERFIGEIDVFWSSDWVQPPLTKARGVTTIHDVSFLRYPDSFHKIILDVHKRRLAWAKRECKAILCDSEATKMDTIEFYNVNPRILHIVYPGIAT